MALTLVAFKLSITDMVPVRTRGSNPPLCVSYLSAAAGQSAVNAVAEALCSVVVSFTQIAALSSCKCFATHRSHFGRAVVCQ
jgi:hypothetical protein